MKLKFSNSFFVLSLLMAIGGSQAKAQNYMQRKEFRNANAHWFMRGYPDRMFDMRTQSPTPTTLPPKAGWYWVGESGSGISDTATGELLFYTDGKSVYNRNHQIMPNGIDLLRNSATSNFWENFASSYQQVVIVPVIDTPNKFHVFSVMSVENPGGLYYCVVDMNLDNGLGDVEIGRRDIHLYKQPLMETITAVPGNNCDVWLMAHTQHDSTFLAYHITAAGLNMVPVVSAVGPASVNKRNGAFERGGLTVSPKRDRIGVVTYDPIHDIWDKAGGWAATMIAQFDPETGKVSEGIVLDTLLIANALTFSPDGNMLYVGGDQMDNLMQTHEGRFLLQYDVSKKTVAEMRASQKRIAELKFGNYSKYIAFRSLGDTIMLADFSYIPFPNQYGTSCGYSNATNYFAPEQNFHYGHCWGNDAVYPLYHYATSAKDTALCEGAQLKLSAATGYRSYHWNDGSTGPELTINREGTYWVKYETSCTTGVDSFYVRYAVLPTPDITIDERDLSTLEEYDSYQWMLDGEIIAGATSRVHTAMVNGLYQVIVSRGTCKVTSEPYKVTNANSIASRLNEESVRMHPNPASSVIYIESPQPVQVSVIGLEGKVYRAEYNVKQIDIRNLAEGLYLVQVRSIDGRLLKVERFTKTGTP